MDYVYAIAEQNIVTTNTVEFFRAGSDLIVYGLRVSLVGPIMLAGIGVALTFMVVAWFNRSGSD